MESNDRLNWQDDSDIEKIIPFDIGTYTCPPQYYRTSPLQ